MPHHTHWNKEAAQRIVLVHAYAALMLRRNTIAEI
ncbi:MAG: hypothetical protein ACJAW4_002019 [Paracoccaceae bacterium]|jgi:hypothetical protein